MALSFENYKMTFLVVLNAVNGRMAPDKIFKMHFSNKNITLFANLTSIVEINFFVYTHTRDHLSTKSMIFHTRFKLINANQKHVIS